MAVQRSLMEFGQDYGKLVLPDFGEGGVTIHFTDADTLTSFTARPASIEVPPPDEFKHIDGEYSIWRREIVRRFEPAWTTVPDHTLILIRSGDMAQLSGAMGGGEWTVTYHHHASPLQRLVAFGPRPALILDWSQLSVFIESHAMLVGMAEKF